MLCEQVIELPSPFHTTRSSSSSEESHGLIPPPSTPTQEELLSISTPLPSITPTRSSTALRTVSTQRRNGHYLTNSKQKALAALLSKRVSIKSQINDTVLHLTLRELLLALKQGFHRAGIALKKNGICIVGSSASNLILVNDGVKYPYEINDVDITFRLMYSESFWEILRIQETVIAGLLYKKLGKKISAHECYNMFFHESLYVDNDKEKWSLISIGSETLTVDMKVVYKCSRPYAFSVDSFEVVIDDFLEGKNNSLVEVRSNYGDFEEAVEHLQMKKLMTNNPGDIYHGFFRYCLELARGNRPENCLYDLIFTARFYEEFRGVGAEYFAKILSKFVNKHKKYWFCILTAMHYLLSIYGNEKTSEYLPVIVQLMFTSKIPVANGNGL